MSHSPKIVAIFETTHTITGRWSFPDNYSPETMVRVIQGSLELDAEERSSEHVTAKLVELTIDGKSVGL